MKIKIGNKNTLNNSNIGENNKIELEKNNNKFVSIIIEITIGIIVTVIGGYLLYKFKIN